VDTVYVNSDMIIAEKREIETGDSVTVVQSGDNNLILGETDAYIYKYR
jgi:flagellar biogenesis protein FliO